MVQRGDEIVCGATKINVYESLFRRWRNFTKSLNFILFLLLVTVVAPLMMMIAHGIAVVAPTPPSVDGRFPDPRQLTEPGDGERATLVYWNSGFPLAARSILDKKNSAEAKKSLIKFFFS